MVRRRACVLFCAIALLAVGGACSSSRDATAIDARPTPSTGDDERAESSAATVEVTSTTIVTSSTAAVTTSAPALGTAVVGAGTATGVAPAAILATPVAAPPLQPGMLSIMAGVTLSAPAPFVGAFTLELPVGPEPSPDAVPGVLHVLDDGTTEVLPGIWDADAGTITVWVSHFSDFFGGWWNPFNWAEEVIQVAQGAFDAVADWATGRTDPPACRNDPPAWSSLTTSQLASVHVCAQSNPNPDDGTERVEVFIKSNRSTAQMITVPTGVDYVWVEDQPDFIRPVLATVMEGYSGSQSVVLFGGKSMSFGLTRPFVDTDIPVRAYVPSIQGVLNQLFGLAGLVDGKDLVALTLATYRCTAEMADFSILQADVIPQGFTDGAQTAMSCALELLSNPDLATSTAAELASGVGGQAGRDFVTGELGPRFKKIAPTAKKLARVLLLAQVSTNTFDAIFDQFAEGLATLTLMGTRVAPPTVDALRNAAVPSICGYPAGTLVDGALPIPDAEGAVGLTGLSAAGDIDGDGVAELAAVFACRGSGVSWPEQIVVFRSDLSYVGVADTGTIFADVLVWRASVQALEYADGAFVGVAWLEISAMDDIVVREVTMWIDDGQLVVVPEEAAAGACASGAFGLEDGTWISEILPVGMSCDQAYPVVTDVSALHDWGDLGPRRVDGFVCTFEETPPEEGEAGAQGDYTCVSEIAQVVRITWVYARGE